MTMTLAIKVLNMIKDNYSMNWNDARIANHKGIPLTSRRWVYTNPYYVIRPYLNGRETGFAIEVSGGKIPSGEELSITFRRPVDEKT